MLDKKIPNNEEKNKEKKESCCGKECNCENCECEECKECCKCCCCCDCCNK